jgi:hypothetical protein
MANDEVRATAEEAEQILFARVVLAREASAESLERIANSADKVFTVLEVLGRETIDHLNILQANVNPFLGWLAQRFFGETPDGS